MARFLPYSIDDMVADGILLPISPSTESGYIGFREGMREFYAGPSSATNTNVLTDPQGTTANGTFWPATTAHTTITGNIDVPVAVPPDLTGLTKCLRLVNDGTADTPVTANLTVTTSRNYQTSLYVYAPTVGGTITITVDTASTYTLATITTANSSFVRYNIYSPSGAGTTAHIHIAFAGGTTSTIYITGAMVCDGELLSTMTYPFFCGATRGCVWTGTANASSSTRTLGITRWPSIGIVNGTIAVRHRPFYNAADSKSHALFYLRNSANSGYSATIDKSASNVYGCAIRGSSATAISSAAQSWAAGTLHHVVLRWTSQSNVDLNCDGTDATQVATAETISGGVIGVGQNWTPTTGADGIIGPAILSTSRKSDAWVTAIQIDSGRAYGNIPRLVRDFMVVGDYIVPFQTNDMMYKKVKV